MSRILIFGASPIALSLARQLEPEELTILDEDAKAVERVRKEGFPAEEIGFTDDEALAELGLDEPGKIAYCFSKNEATNVYLVLSLRELSGTLTIVAYAETDESRKKLSIAGADQVIDPYEISAGRIEEFIRRPYVADVLDSTLFSRSDVQIREMEIPEGSALAGEDLTDIVTERMFNLIVVGIIDRERGSDFVFASPRKRYHLDPGDVLVLLGRGAELERFREYYGL